MRPITKRRAIFGSILVAAIAVVFMFQNFKWYDLIRGGPGDELFEAEQLDAQVDWLASVKTTKIQIQTTFAQTRALIDAKLVVPDVQSTMPAQYQLASQFIVASVKDYIDRMLRQEQYKQVNPTFFYLQDDKYLEGKLPDVPFKINYAKFDQAGNVLDKGNEELISEIIDWRWQAMYTAKYLEKGGNPLVALRLYADPAPLLNPTKRLIEERIITGITPIFLKVDGTRLANPPDSGANIPELSALNAQAQASFNKLALALFLSQNSKQYQLLIDKVLAQYAQLGTPSIYDYEKAHPNLYNGEDINPVLFDYSIPKRLGSEEEIKNYVDLDKGIALLGASTVDTLKNHKEMLEADYGTAKVSAYIQQMQSCASVHNSLMSEAGKNIASLSAWVTNNSTKLSAAKTTCKNVVGRGVNGMFYLSRLTSLTRSHQEYLAYLLRQKAIEDKFTALRTQLAGTELGQFIEFTEANPKVLQKYVQEVSEIDNRYRITGPDTSSSENSIGSFSPEEFQYRTVEFRIDIPSTLRRLVIKGNIDPSIGSKLDMSTSLKVFGAFRQMYDCKESLESKLGQRIENAYNSKDWVNLDAMINQIKLSDVGSYCAGMWRNHGNLNAPQSPLLPVLEMIANSSQNPSVGSTSDSSSGGYTPPSETNTGDYSSSYSGDETLHNMIYARDLYLKKVVAALMTQIGSNTLFMPARNQRTMGSYFVNPCEKSVLNWKHNNGFVPAAMTPTTKEGVLYKTAVNPTCFGIDGGVKFAYRKSSSDGLDYQELIRRQNATNFFNQVILDPEVKETGDGI